MADCCILQMVGVKPIQTPRARVAPSQLGHLPSSSITIPPQCLRILTTSLNMKNPKITKLLVRASTPESQQEQPQQRFGLGGPGTWFGFGRNQERQVGRLAMVGFMAGIVMEIVTGKGVLGQLGIDALKVRFPFLAGFLFLLVAGLLGGYVVIENPPDASKAPPNAGAGLPRNPLKTFDPKSPEPLTTWTRGGIVDLPSGQKGREPYVSELDNNPPPS